MFPKPLFHPIQKMLRINLGVPYVHNIDSLLFLIILIDEFNPSLDKNISRNPLFILQQWLTGSRLWELTDSFNLFVGLPYKIRSYRLTKSFGTIFQLLNPVSLSFIKPLNHHISSAIHRLVSSLLHEGQPCLQQYHALPPRYDDGLPLWSSEHRNRSFELLD